MTTTIGLLVGEVTADRGQDWPDIWTTCFEMALADVTDRGAVEQPVQLVTRVAEGLPTGSAHAVMSAWRELADEGVVAVLGPSNADNGMTVVPTANDGGVSTILFGCSEQLASPWTFSVPWGSAPEDALLAMQWVASRGHGSVAVLWDTAWHAEEWFAYGRRSADGLGIDVVGDVRIPALVMDDPSRDAQLAAARAGIERLRQLGPDAIVMMTSHGAIPFATALRDSGWDIARVIAGGSFGAARGLPELFEGWVGTCLWDDENPDCLEFLQRYEKLAGRRPTNEDMPLVVHDGCRALLAGIGLAPIMTRDGVRQGLERVKAMPACAGAPSTVLSFGPYDHRGYKGRSMSVLRRQAGPRRDDCVREPLDFRNVATGTPNVPRMSPVLPK